MIDKDILLLKSCIKRFCKDEDSQLIGSLLQDKFYKLAEYKDKNKVRIGQALVNIVSYNGSYSQLYFCEDDSLVLSLIAEELWN